MSRFSVSRCSSYRRLLVATGVSSLGDGVRLVAMPLLATSLTDDPRLITGVFVADRLPWLLFLLPGGALADRFDRLRMRVLLDAFRAVLGVVFVAIIATGQMSLAIVFLITILMASADAFVDSSSMALVPALAEPEQMEEAIGQLQSTEIVTRDLIGPAVGGVLFAAGLTAPMVLDTVSFAVSAAVAATIGGTFRATRSLTAARSRPGVGAAVREMSESIRDGLTWLLREPALRSLAALSTLLCTVSMMSVSVFVVFATDDLRLGATGFGLLMIPSAVGGLVGAWMAPRLRHLPLGAAAGAAVVIAGVADIMMAYVGAIVVIAVLLMVDTAGVLVWNVLTVAYRQRAIPDELLGRVNSSYRFLLSLGAPFGAVIGGVLASAYGARTTLAIAGTACCCGGVVAAVVIGRTIGPRPLAVAAVT
ncbi:MFS transporter [Ilumatobacter sp.]|uniref:MFS transporter n=1 Tax=Ilumatobacter sp. TaxID=1967498 RepID=UPI003C50079E